MIIILKKNKNDASNKNCYYYQYVVARVIVLSYSEIPVYGRLFPFPDSE